MGCVKSRYSDLNRDANAVESKTGKAANERVSLVYSEVGSEESALRINPVLLDYAQRLSEDIVARAVQQWAELDSRYSDIPYIECDLP